MGLLLREGRDGRAMDEERRKEEEGIVG